MKKILFLFIFAFFNFFPFIYSLENVPFQIQKVLEYHPEILWLANGEVRHTEEGYEKNCQSYSEHFFGKKYIEFDRTLMTLYCLKLIVEGSEESYEKFTSAQPFENKLSKVSFNQLHSQAKELISSHWNGLTEKQMEETMEAALVLGDIGKSEKARTIFKPLGPSAPDHDDFYEEMILVLEKHPHLCPTFSKLSPIAKKLLKRVANLAHYGHITHLEGSAGMYQKLYESGLAYRDPIALSFDLSIHTCDVAGALGHLNNQSSLVYTATTHSAMHAMRESVLTLRDPHINASAAYENYLNQRALWLNLNPHSKVDRALVRAGAMLRLFTPQEGAILLEAFNSLREESQILVTKYLNVDDLLLPRTPTYIPAFLVNLFNNPELGETKEERLKQTIVLGLPFVCRVIKKYEELLSCQRFNKDIPLNFNKMAEVAKKNPQLLQFDFLIDDDGTVRLSSF